MYTEAASKLTAVALVVLPPIAAHADTMCADGQWHADGVCKMCPDGSWTTAPKCTMSPDGNWTPRTTAAATRWRLMAVGYPTLAQ
jgi:cytochrome c5